MKTAKIVVATHKIYSFPDQKIYLPLLVNAKNLKKDLNITDIQKHKSSPANIKLLSLYTNDDTKKNISEKNPTFCELTALYWAWKNLKEDYIGLVHYRRYLSNKSRKHLRSVKNRLQTVLTTEELDSLINSKHPYDLILPKPRRYYIETLHSHYQHTLHIEPLNETRKIIAKVSPKYLKEFDELKVRRSAHMFNIFIAKKELVDDYCSWLFPILFELEKELKKEKLTYSKFHQRFYGRISELLFDVWLYTNYPKNSSTAKKIRIKELPVIEIEHINYLKKIVSFLVAKFLHKRYEKSF